jgi:hypothetical protein
MGHEVTTELPAGSRHDGRRFCGVYLSRRGCFRNEPPGYQPEGLVRFPEQVHHVFDSIAPLGFRLGFPKPG